jgi:hypothetical protein
MGFTPGSGGCSGLRVSSGCGLTGVDPPDNRSPSPDLPQSLGISLLISASLPLSFPSLLSTLSLSLVSLSLSRLDYARVEEQKRRKRKKKEEENNKEQEGRTGHGN